MLPSKGTQEQTDYRLVHHLCVWCSNKLDDNSPDATFDTPECQNAWHYTTNAYALMALQATVPNRHKANPIPDLGEQWVPRDTEGADDPVQRERDDITIRSTISRERPGMLAPAPRRSHTGQLMVRPHTPRPGGEDLPAIETIPAELTLQPYPHLFVSWMKEQGGWWEVGEMTGHPLRSDLRHCQQCQDWQPAGKTQKWQWVDATQGTLHRVAQTCPTCWTEHPDEPAVPMARPGAGDAGWGDGSWEIAIVTHRGWTTRDIPVQAMRDHDAIDQQWQTMREAMGGTRGLNPCALPGCGKPAVKALLLHTELHYQGWAWQATDNEPLRIGTCTAHSAQILTGLAMDGRQIRSGREDNSIAYY